MASGSQLIGGNGSRRSCLRPQSKVGGGGREVLGADGAAAPSLISPLPCVFSFFIYLFLLVVVVVL